MAGIAGALSGLKASRKSTTARRRHHYNSEAAPFHNQNQSEYQPGHLGNLNLNRLQTLGKDDLVELRKKSHNEDGKDRISFATPLGSINNSKPPNEDKQVTVESNNEDADQEAQDETEEDEPDRISPGMFGRPIEELDQLLTDNTFCVLAKKFKKYYAYRFSASKSYGLFDPNHCFRRLCIRTYTNELFDLFFMFVIIINCIALAFDNNEWDDDGNLAKNNVPDYIKALEWPFLLLFTVEAIIKITCSGFYFNKYSYLKNHWNKLDFFIVVSGYLTDFLENTLSDQHKELIDLDVFRAFRVLRALKIISIFPGLRVMLNSITNSIVQLIEVMILILFCLSIFALFAINLFGGKLRQVCVKPNMSLDPPCQKQPALTLQCHNWLTNTSNWQQRKFPKEEPLPCGFDTYTRKCRSPFDCQSNLGRNPDDSWTSFDNFLEAMLTTFQVLTLDFWERIYDLVLSTVGLKCLPFFVMVIFVGSFYLMNLMLAVVAKSYEVEVTKVEEERSNPLSALEKLAKNRSSLKFSLDDPLHDFQIIRFKHYKLRTPAERERLTRKFRETKYRRQTGRSLDTSNALSLGDLLMDIFGIGVTKGRKSRHRIPDKRYLERQKHKAEISEKAEMQDDTYDFSCRVEDGEILGEDAIVEGNEFDALDEEERDENPFGFLSKKSSHHVGILPDSIFVDSIWGDYIIGSGGRKYEVAEKKTRSLQLIFSFMEKLRIKLEAFVNHWVFDSVITISILANTIFLAYDHFDEDFEKRKKVEHITRLASNIFTGIFTFECVVKIFALRENYFQQKWNLLDLFIVGASLVDVGLQTLQNEPSQDISKESSQDRSKEFAALNAVRILRLLRILKLAQSWTTMKILLNIIFSTFGSLANLTVVLFIMIYIFAVLGMQIVGKRYVLKNFGLSKAQIDQFPRWNFRNFWFSFMMIFRVLCGEWIEPLWDCLKMHEKKERSDLFLFNETLHNEEWKCFILFFPSLIIGNFVVLNLFLALLLNSFSSEEIEAQRLKEQETSGKLSDMTKVVEVLVSQKVVKQTTKEVNQNILALLAAALNAQHPENRFTIKIDEEKEPKPQVLFKKAAQLIIMKQRVVRAENAIVKAEENERMKEFLALESLDTKKKEKLAEEACVFEKNELIDVFARKREEADENGYDINRIRSTASLVSLDEDMNVAVEELEDDKITEVPDCFPERWTKWNNECCEFWYSSREFAFNLVSSSCFEWTIIALILASSITLCFDDFDREQNRSFHRTLNSLDIVFTAIFLAELLLKLLAFGFWEYFTTFWTLLDFGIVTISIVDLYFHFHEKSQEGGKDPTETLGALRAFRVLRALRPLRAISRWEGMKVVVNALMYSIPSIINVLVVCLLFWLVFAIMGVQLFKGKFYRCLNDEGEKIKNVNMTECCNRTNNGIWINFVPNFDNVPMAYLSLFQIATFEGWIEIMEAASDITSVDHSPERDVSYASNIFFVIFIIFGSFFTLNLFIGVIIDNFNTLKRKYEGNFNDALLTESQRRYYSAVKKLGRQKPRTFPKRPESPYFAIFYDTCTSPKFDNCITIMIVINVITMAFESYNQSRIAAKLITGINLYFAQVFAMEAVIKIIALGKFYFKVPWNIFDFILVLGSVFDVMFTSLHGGKLPFPPTLLRIVRVFRIGRVLRLVKAVKGIRKLLFTLVLSLPALFNVGALLSLIVFIYSIVGMALFKNAAFIHYNEAEANGPLDGFFSFRTFGESFLLLFRLFTAAGWNEVLDSLMVVERSRHCNESFGNYTKIKCSNSPDAKPGVECISPFTAVAFMVSYIFITYLIIINMYIAVILENFDEANRDEDIGIFEDDIEAFYTTWNSFDPDATQFIGFEQLSTFLASLDKPFQIPQPNILILVALDFPIVRGNKLHCLDILHILVRRVLGKVENGEEFQKVKRLLDQKFQQAFPKRKFFDIISSTKIWRCQLNAAIIIQQAWRDYKNRQRQKKVMIDIAQTMYSSINKSFVNPPHDNTIHKRRNSSIPDEQKKSEFNLLPKE